MVSKYAFFGVLAILIASDAFLPYPFVPNTSPAQRSVLFGKKKKGGVGGGGGQRPQEKQSVKDARFDAATRQFMFSLVGLTKILPDKSKKILDNIHLSFYPGAKIGIVGLNGSGKVITFGFCIICVTRSSSHADICSLSCRRVLC
jgi:ABC-type multidrug transport system fused ATPase/permease subunit